MSFDNKLFRALRQFTMEMQIKFVKKMKAGHKGWDKQEPTNQILIRKMEDNIKNEDWVDVANLATILHWRKTNL